MVKNILGKVFSFCGEWKNSVEEVCLAKKFGVINTMPYRLSKSYTKSRYREVERSYKDGSIRRVPWIRTGEDSISIAYEGDLTGYSEHLDCGLWEYTNCFGMTFYSDDFEAFYPILDYRRIRIPETVSSIGPNAFGGFVNTVLEVPAGVMVHDEVFGGRNGRGGFVEHYPRSGQERPAIRELGTLDGPRRREEIPKWLYLEDRTDLFAIHADTLRYDLLPSSTALSEKCMEYLDHRGYMGKCTTVREIGEPWGIDPSKNTTLYYIRLDAEGRRCEIVVDDEVSVSIFVRRTKGAESWADGFAAELMQYLCTYRPNPKGTSLE